MVLGCAVFRGECPTFESTKLERSVCCQCFYASADQTQITAAIMQNAESRLIKLMDRAPRAMPAHLTQFSDATGGNDRAYAGQTRSLDW